MNEDEAELDLLSDQWVAFPCSSWYHHMNSRTSVHPCNIVIACVILRNKIVCSLFGSFIPMYFCPLNAWGFKSVSKGIGPLLCSNYLHGFPLRSFVLLIMFCHCSISDFAIIECHHYVYKTPSCCEALALLTRRSSQLTRSQKNAGNLKE